MTPSELIDRYATGPLQLRKSVEGLSDEQLDARPVAGMWSTRQVVCHIADFEIVYADRMKRVLAESEPTLFGGDPDLFASALAYAQRDVEDELQVIESVRRQLTRILRTVPEQSFERIGNHSEAGPLSLAKLLGSVTDHIPHHVNFIQQKRAAMSSSSHP